jgi:dipicolinate synthase subunit B
MIVTNNLQGVKIAYALTGSYCTFAETIVQMEKLVELKAEIIPIMSQNAYSTNTRFGDTEMFREKIEKICGRGIIHTIESAEPIGPKKMADVLVVAPWWERK